MKILEIGNYIAPAYAGMILAEQNFEVTKYIYQNKDPILSLNQGQEIWEWINYKKILIENHISHAIKNIHNFDVIIDNFKIETLKKWEIDPIELSKKHNLVWISLRPEINNTSFDVIAQAQAWADITGFVDFYIGDTIAGLWIAFKAMSMFLQKKCGHFIIPHATGLAKLIEGELIIDRPNKKHPYDPENYGYNKSHAIVEYKKNTFLEPIRDKKWKLKNLRHKNGRLII